MNLKRILPLLIIPFAACQDDTLQDVYHGQQNDTPQENIAPFPLKVGERFVYMWNIKKQGNCQDENTSEQSMQLFQCTKILAIDESGGEVKVTSWTKFNKTYPLTMNEDQFAAYSRTMSPSWLFKMAPDNLADYSQTPEITYFTQRTPRPYEKGLGADGLDYRAVHFIDLRDLGPSWGGWQENAEHNFRQDFSTYFVENFSETNAFFQVQRTDPYLYEAGYSWREAINNEQAVHAVYFEYNDRGVLTSGNEVVLFDNGAIDKLPAAPNVLSQSCSYNNSIVVNIVDCFSSGDLEYYWNSKCQ